MVADTCKAHPFEQSVYVLIQSHSAGCTCWWQVLQLTCSIHAAHMQALKSVSVLIPASSHVAALSFADDPESCRALSHVSQQHTYKLLK